MIFFLLLMVLPKLMGEVPSHAPLPPLKVCYISSELGDVLPRANDLPIERAGFALAVKNYTKNSKNKVSFEVFAGQIKENDVLAGKEWAMKQNCHVAVGLVTSRDALLFARSSTEKFSTVGFSSTATADDLDAFFPSVISAATSMSSWVNALKNEVRKMRDVNLYVISKPDDVYSVLFTEKLSFSLGARAQIIKVNLKNEIPDAVFNTLKTKEKSIFLYTMYPILSLPSLKQIAGLNSALVKKNWQVYGTHSWLESHTFNANGEIASKLPPTFVFTPWQVEKPNALYEIFEREYQLFAHQVPDHDSAYDYDVMNMIFACYEKYSDFSLTLAEYLKKCLASKRHFEGVTGAYVYNGFNSHPVRQEYRKQLNFSGKTTK